MGCCKKSDSAYSLEGGTGLTKNRKCTDVLFIIIFLAVCAGMGFVVAISLPTGSWYGIIYGRDSWGNNCNAVNKPIENVTLSGKNTVGLTKTFYMNPMALVSIDGSTETSAVLCVNSCPQQNIESIDDLKGFASTTENDTKLCHYDVLPEDYDDHYTVVGGYPQREAAEKCPLMPVMEQLDIMNRCIPTMLTELSESGIDSAITSSSQGLVSPTCEKEGSFLEKAWGDVLASGMHILYLSLIALGVSFVITILMGVVATIIIWTMLIIMVLGSLAATALCWYKWFMKYKAIQDLPSGAEATASEKEDLRNWMIIAIVVSVVALIILLILLVMRKRIKLVAQLFMEASSAMRKMPLLLLQPLFVFIYLICILGVLIVGAGYILTAHDRSVTDPDTGFVTYQSVDLIWWLSWFYLFGTLWWIQFIFACEQMVIAGAVSIWFFTRDKSSLGLPIGKSIKNLLRYHLGTVLFGSFIIALVKLIQIVLGYIERTLSGKSNKAVKFILKCLQLCLWCFEKCMKFINKNAYIMTAIHGHSFCRGAWAAFQVIIGNALRVAAINSVGAFCLLLGKLGVVAITVYLGFQFFIGPNEELCFFFIPLILVGVIAFIIAHCFLGVYSMTIDTIFICFCEDCTHNDGVEKPYFMSKGLMEFVEGSKEAEKKSK